MESVRKKIILWLFGERFTELEAKMEKIEKYLSSISDFADYVKDKDEKAAEVFALVEELKVIPEMSRAEITEAIHNASLTKHLLLESPAIGASEIQLKNSSIFQVDNLLKELGKKLTDADKASK